MKKTIITLTLVVAVALIAIVGIKILKSDDSNGDNLDELFSTTNTTNASTFQATENTSMLVTDENNETTEHLMTPEEFLAATSNVPSYSISWNVDEVIEYNGGEVTTEVTILNGSFKIEKGFSISLNGVLQECTIECDGKKTEQSTMPKLIFDAGQERTFKISFIPNIGKTGDELEMSLLHSYLPSYRVTENMETKVLMGQENRVLDALNKTLKLNVDSTNENCITDSFSGAKVDKLNKTLYVSHNYENVEGDIFNDAYEANRVVLYHEFDKVYTVSKGVFYDNVECLTSMTLPRADKTSVTINLYGKPGKRRVCLLINNELQPVFDGKYYADVEFKEGEQVELVVEIDTSNLDKYNSIYALSKELNEVPNSSDHLLKQSDPYVLIVE